MTDTPAVRDVDSAQHPKRRRVRFVVLSVVLTIVVVEIVLRFFMGNMKIAPLVTDPGDGRCVGLKPGVKVTYTGWRWRIPPVDQGANSLGYRGREYDRGRSPNTLRIATMGDSFTYGVGVPAGKTIPSYLEAALKKPIEKRVEVLNFGLPGMSLSDSREQYGFFASKWQPDLVLFFLFDNDLDESFCTFTKALIKVWMLRNVYLFRILYMVFASGHIIGSEENEDRDLERELA